MEPKCRENTKAEQLDKLEGAKSTNRALVCALSESKSSFQHMTKKESKNRSRESHEEKEGERGQSCQGPISEFGGDENEIRKISTKQRRGGS